MLIFSSHSLKTKVSDLSSTYDDYKQVLALRGLHTVSSIDEAITALNNLVNKKSLLSLGLEIKQKTDQFSPYKTIRFSVKPLPTIHIWFAKRPSAELGEYMDLHHLSSLINSVMTEFCSLFDSGQQSELSTLGILYFTEENYKRELKKLSKKIARSVWAKSKRLDVPSLFPLARSLKRKIIVFAGPTSSGKTYHALELLKAANSGLYLGPLRLNALEVFDNLNDSGVPCSLITGEEKVLTDGARHQASTSEMANYVKEVDVTVVDEIQFMDDIERGWAFCNAIIGAPSKFVIVTCPEYAIEKVVRLAKILGDEVEIHRLPRKTKLTVTSNPSKDLSSLIEGTAIVSFSRKRIFQLKAELEKTYKVSVIYGGMPPDVRKEQARRFRDGETSVVIATDAIGIGLNLPIQHLIFDTVEKYDGVEQRKLHQCELLQVAGRAGRYNMYDEGFVSGMSWGDHEYICQALSRSDETVLSFRFFAKIPFHTVVEYMQISGVFQLSRALIVLSEKISYDKNLYELSSIDLLIENISVIERQNLEIPVDDIWRIAHIPVEIKDCERTFLDALSCVSGVVKGVYIDTSPLSSYLPDAEKLFQLEKLNTQLDCLNWFKVRYPDSFTEIEDSYIKTLREQVVKSMNDTVLKIR